MTSRTRPECPKYFERDIDDDAMMVYRNGRHGVGVIPDIRPVAKGHTLTVPFECVPSVDDLSVTRYLKLQLAAKYAGLWLRELYGIGDTYIASATAGNQVPHAHIHRFPAGIDNEAWARFDGAEPRIDMRRTEVEDLVREIRFPEELAAELDAALGDIAPPEFPEGARLMGRLAVNLAPENNR